MEETETECDRTVLLTMKLSVKVVRINDQKLSSDNSKATASDAFSL
jgi:hypothetical protein